MLDNNNNNNKIEQAKEVEDIANEDKYEREKIRPDLVNAYYSINTEIPTRPREEPGEKDGSWGSRDPSTTPDSEDA